MHTERHLDGKSALLIPPSCRITDSTPVIKLPIGTNAHVVAVKSINSRTAFKSRALDSFFQAFRKWHTAHAVPLALPALPAGSDLRGLYCGFIDPSGSKEHPHAHITYVYFSRAVVASSYHTGSL